MFKLKWGRAVLFGVILWVFIFVIISILMFVPPLKDRDMLQLAIYWILLIPLALFLCKWYFKEDAPTAKKGLMLGIMGLIVGGILDIAVTIPLFVKSYSAYYSSWSMYVGFVELLIITTYAGYEFDSTFTKRSIREPGETIHNDENNK